MNTNSLQDYVFEILFDSRGTGRNLKSGPEVVH